MNSAISHHSSDGVPPPINWYYLWALVRQRIGLFAACFLAVLLLSVIYILHSPRLYESRAVIQVEQREHRTLKTTDSASDEDDLTSEDSVKTIEQNLQNYTLFLNVVNNPAIARDPAFLVGYPGDKNQPSPVDEAAWVRSNTKVVLRHGTRLIDVTVDHQVPAMAQKLAQAVIDTFVLMNDQAQTAAQQSALKLLVGESDEEKESLQKSEDSLQIYKDTLLLKDRIEDQQRVIDALKQRYREKHPQLIQARALLADLMLTFDQEFRKVTENSSTEASYWASKSNELSSASPSERIPTELKLVEARSQVLQKEVDTESALFDNILKQMRETDVSQDSTATETRVSEPAVLPTWPAKPRKLLILFLGFVGGLALGATAVAVANAIDSTLKTSIEAEALLQLPVLGRILLLSKKRSQNADKTTQNQLVVLTHPGGAAAESFRSMRASIDLLRKSSDNRSILFTSALPGEGKTFVSCNYALALAQAGYRTLLIDTDLRRPAVHSRFKLGNDVGLVNVLTGEIDLSEAVHPNVFKNLDVLSTGARCPNPAELLAGTAFMKILPRILAAYDRVVFDSSPVNLVSDSLLIAGYVSSVFLVIRTAGTTRQASLHAATLLRRAQKEAAGIILNAVPPGHDRLYFGYKSGDEAAYSSVYSSDEP
jgi:succinoglycan biosynthesis transport protein ExoP